MGNQSEERKVCMVDLREQKMLRGKDKQHIEKQFFNHTLNIQQQPFTFETLKVKSLKITIPEWTVINTN